MGKGTYTLPTWILDSYVKVVHFEENRLSRTLDDCHSWNPSEGTCPRCPLWLCQRWLNTLSDIYNPHPSLPNDRLTNKVVCFHHIQMHI